MSRDCKGIASEAEPLLDNRAELERMSRARQRIADALWRK